MGSHEPVEQWAAPESLDPTPVWKQYLVVTVLGLGLVLAAAAYVYVAFLPDLVTPPAAIPGRVILAASEYAPGTTKAVDLGRAFYLTNVGGDYVAVTASWSPQVGGTPCAVELASAVSANARFMSCDGARFDESGRALGGAPRGLDRYLVSRKGDRLIVNTGHLIQGK